MRRKPRSPDADASEIQLPEAELEVLAALRELEEASVADVREYVGRFRPMSHASVSTLLKRLGQKQLVRRRKADQGKAFLYSAADEAAAPLGREVNRVLQRLFGGDSGSLVASLLGQHRPDQQELERLKGLVDDLWAERDGGKGS